jgi:hypothetical protein
MIAILGSALALAIAPQPITHTVAIQHENAPINATYKADVAVSTRQVGLSAGTRPSTARCQWQARVGVIRDVAREQGATYSRRIDGEKLIEGSHAGTCAATAGQVERELEAAAPAVQAHVVEMARRDEQSLRADLKTMSQLAQN